MGDRTSTVQAGSFEISTDKDHLGNYRGHQAMERGKFRGWHYHVTSSSHSQIEITMLIEQLLWQRGARVITPARLGIGNVEYKTAAVSCWELDGKQTVLWLSGYNFSLHVETNKNATYAKGILTKDDLIKFFKAIA